MEMKEIPANSTPAQSIPFTIPASDTHQFNLNVIKSGQIALSSLEAEMSKENCFHP